MTVQEWTVLAVGAGTVAYLVWRVVRRRVAGTCCGERDCPAAKTIVRELQRGRSAERP